MLNSSTTFTNSSSGFKKFLENKFNENDVVFNVEDVKAGMNNALLQKIVQKPVTDGLKNFLNYDDDQDNIRELHQNTKIKYELMKIANHFRAFGTTIVIYKDGNSLDTSPSSNFEGFLVYNNDEIEWVDENVGSPNYTRVLKVEVSEAGEVKNVEVNEDRYFIIDGKSEALACLKYVKYLENSLDIPVAMMGNDQVNYMKMPNLARELGNCGDNCEESYNRLYSKMQTVFQMMNNFNLAPIDQDEEFGQITKSTSSYKSLQDFIMVIISAVSEIPSTILFGKSPSGFSSGDHEVENYYNYVSSEIQFKIFTPALDFLHDKMNITLKAPLEYAPIKHMSTEEMDKHNNQKAINTKNRTETINILIEILDKNLTDESIINYIFSNKLIETSDLVELDDDLKEDNDEN